MKKGIFYVGIICLSFALTGCIGNQEKPVAPDTETNLANLVRLAFINGNYGRFNNLFSEERKNSVSEDAFNEIRKNIAPGGAEFINYELIKLPDGKAMLIRITPEKDAEGNYKIEDLKVISQDDLNLFP